VRLLHQADWIVFRLGAPLGVSDANNALKSGYDPLAEAWPAWIEGLGLSRALLPEVVRPGTVIGTVRAGPSLPSGAALVAGTTDGCAAFLATGAAVAGEAVSSLGSTLTVKLLSDRPVFAPDYGVYSHRLGDAWLAGGASNSGGAVLARFFDPPALAELSARIDPVRESGLDYYPLATRGERFPIADPALPPRLSPRPADDAAFLHGLLEGIARVEALGYRRLAELGAPTVTHVLTVGGGAANRAWMAIRARVLGVRVEAAPSADAALGAARLALRAL
jgi:sugar (pentulose or hexulose) kinase